MKQRLFIRNLQAAQRLQSFLVSAITAVLAIRLYLDLTGYPQLGGGGLHVAHMLWGGLLMLAAIVILLSFVSKASERLAAIVGGFGFGTFIDEVGKFLTSDNDYFFRPAVAIIYVIFILILLAIRAIHAGRTYTSQEYLVNALQEMEEVAMHDLDEEERKRAMLYLEKSDPQNPLVIALKDSLVRASLQPIPTLWLPERIKHSLRRLYFYLAGLSWFRVGVVVFFIGQMLLKTVYILVLVFLGDLRWQELLRLEIVERTEHLSFINWAQIISTLLSAVFVIMGIIRIRRSKLFAYRMFERSVLVSIFLTQVFVFYHEQFYALVGLVFNILVLVTLRFMIGRERAAEAASIVKDAIR
jgi:hypothetical protein